jgi:hypothetical protein
VGIEFTVKVPLSASITLKSTLNRFLDSDNSLINHYIQTVMSKTAFYRQIAHQKILHENRSPELSKIALAADRKSTHSLRGWRARWDLNPGFPAPQADALSVLDYEP